MNVFATEKKCHIWQIYCANLKMPYANVSNILSKENIQPEMVKLLDYFHML